MDFGERSVEPARIKKSAHTLCEPSRSGSQRPGCDRQAGEGEGDDDVEGAGAVVGAGGMREGGAGKVEENAGVGPFFEPGETGDQDGDEAEDFPDAEEGHDIGRVSDEGHSFDGVGGAKELADAAGEEEEGEEDCGGPVGDWFGFHVCGEYLSSGQAFHCPATWRVAMLIERCRDYLSKGKVWRTLPG